MLEHEQIEWPVAQIPDPELATIPAGTPMLPLRWPHHGDLRILVPGHRDGVTPSVWVAAEDLLQLLDFGFELEDVVRPGEVGTWRDPAGPLVEVWPLADATRFAADFPTHQTVELIEWLQDTLPAVVTDEVLDGAVGLESFLGTWTVQQAAIILDRDPAVTIGRKRLFDHLHQLGLVDRDDAGRWTPTGLAIRHGWLTVRGVHISGGPSRGRYDQVHVTSAGLAHLRETLGAAPAALVDVDEPTPLFP